MNFDEYLKEEKSVKRIIAIYAGRFQPFHISHNETYQNTVKKFGKENVFIATSDKIDLPKSPFNFKEKIQIMNMFGIPKKNIVQVKNTYSPKEITAKFDKNTTAVVSVVGKKDADRLSKGKYFDFYKDGVELEGYRDKGYVWVAPPNSGMSGTEVRNVFTKGSDEEKKTFFNKLYPKFNQKMYDLISSKIGQKK